MTDLKEFIVLGLMSGTSMDGVDLALCKFSDRGNRFSYDLIAAKTITYPYYLREKLDDALNLSANDLHILDQELGEFYASQINGFLKNQQHTPVLIASHGHTVVHQPDKGITLQIGDGDLIAKNTGYMVINDFRLQDVSKGGQGAPLVPVGDRDLFGSYHFCVNLGGIANVSFDVGKKRIACDIVPCNMPLNTISSWINIEYDRNGAMAARGNIHQDLLDRLNALDYYQLPAPKSLGKEWFLRRFLPEIRKTRITIEDLLRTVNEHISDQISIVINDQCNSESTILLTGGGVHNQFLISLLQEKCIARLHIPEEDLINFKEAIIFAYLGLLRYRNKINILSSVTGASSDTSAGVINHPN